MRSLFLIIFFSISLVFFIHSLNRWIQIKEVTKKIAVDNILTHSTSRLLLEPSLKKTTAETLDVEDVYFGYKNMEDGESGLGNVISMHLCDYKENYCSSNEELHKLISSIETSSDKELLLSLVKKLWYMAADLGAPEPAISALRYLTEHADHNIAELAARALNDLVRLNERNAVQMTDDMIENTFFTSNQESVNITGEGLTGDVDTIKKIKAKNVRKIQELRMTGLNEHQPEKRILAVKKLSSYREIEVIDALIVAAYDVDNRVRYNAVNALWIVGSDNKNNPEFRQVLSVLDLATMDLDLEVAGLAIKALEDFKRTEETNVSANDLYTTNTTLDNPAGVDISSFDSSMVLYNQK